MQLIHNLQIQVGELYRLKIGSGERRSPAFLTLTTVPTPLDDPTRVAYYKKLSLSDAIDACKATEATNRRLRTMN